MDDVLHKGPSIVLIDSCPHDNFVADWRAEVHAANGRFVTYRCGGPAWGEMPAVCHAWCVHTFTGCMAHQLAACLSTNVQTLSPPCLCLHHVSRDVRDMLRGKPAPGLQHYLLESIERNTSISPGIHLYWSESAVLRIRVQTGGGRRAMSTSCILCCDRAATGSPTAFAFCIRQCARLVTLAPAWCHCCLLLLSLYHFAWPHMTRVNRMHSCSVFCTAHMFYITTAGGRQASHSQAGWLCHAARNSQQVADGRWAAGGGEGALPAARGMPACPLFASHSCLVRKLCG